MTPCPPLAAVSTDTGPDPGERRNPARAVLRRLAVGLLAALVLAAVPASARTQTAKPATAKPAASQSVRALFRQGMAALEAARRSKGTARAAQLDRAIAVFRAILVRRPGLVRVRLELARAFFHKGEDTLARRHFERVLAGKPPAAVAANVNRFLAAIRARKRWSVRVGMALAPDSNLGARTDGRTILIDTPFGRLPFTYNNDDAPTSGIGLALWAGGEYQVPLDRFWRLRVGGDLSRREYQGDRFDRTFIGVHAGPRRLISPRTEASLLASTRLSWLSDEPDFRDLGFRFEGRYRLNPRLAATLDAAWHDRRYPGRARLDGPLVDLAAGIGWTALPTLRLNTAAGWAMQRTKQENQRNASRWLRAGATALLPWGFTVGGAGTVRWTGYEGNWAPFVLGGGARRDRTWSLRLNLHNRAFTVRGFSPQVSAVYERRTSNAQLHDYKRFSGELRFVRLF